MQVDRRWLLSSFAGLALAPLDLRAQPRFELEDGGARVQRLAANVFAILHSDATDEWPHSNVGVIVGRRSVFVIDSTYLPSRARADIALIRRLTGKPVGKLATTHWHFDHNNGAVAYREAFPGVELIAERESARWLALNQTWWARMSTAPDSQRRAGLAELERALELGSGADNVPFPAAERARRAEIVRQRRAELRELETLQVVAPDRLFDGRLSLDFEGTRIEIRDWGPANSPHDATFWLPGQRILFAGDIVVKSPLPYTGASWPVHWVRVLRALEALPVAQLVPGHGPVMQDHAYTRAVRGLLEAALQRVNAMILAGRTLAQIQDGLHLDDVRAAVPEWNGSDVPAEDWTYTRRTLAERCWVGLRGQGGR
jgi:glyoxylase-like metal-dependent hydrolase (beta-lactamase superfamily II)